MVEIWPTAEIGDKLMMAGYSKGFFDIHGPVYWLIESTVRHGRCCSPRFQPGENG